MSTIFRDISFETLTCRYCSTTQEKLSHSRVRINKAITEPDHLQYQDIRAGCDDQFVSLEGAFMAISKLEQIACI